MNKSDEIAELARKGERARQIAKTVGASRALVYAVCHRRGITLEPTPLGAPKRSP